MKTWIWDFPTRAEREHSDAGRGTDLEREAPFGVVAELFATIRTATQGTAIQGGAGAAGSGGLLSGHASRATPAVLVVAVRSGEEAADQRTLDWLRERAGHRVLKPGALSRELHALGLRPRRPPVTRPPGR